MWDGSKVEERLVYSVGNGVIVTAHLTKEAGLFGSTDTAAFEFAGDDEACSVHFRKSVGEFGRGLALVTFIAKIGGLSLSRTVRAGDTAQPVAEEDAWMARNIVEHVLPFQMLLHNNPYFVAADKMLVSMARSVGWSFETHFKFSNMTRNQIFTLLLAWYRQLGFMPIEILELIAKHLTSI